ncbi:hypothetical protein I7G59_06365 [Sinorhizobium meliloti]|uniref:hypothetical protein n=1 Tax=Rhizobium meliloti TaxID=382 RepID=UPI0023805B16|nr:hypothetical protein [Sinorhizobium meliloti]MDE3796957.1 hypothetical protein [Sinorhizobium meliloti]
MTINTKEDWIAEARYVVPLLPEYMASVSGQADPSMIEAELNKHLAAEDWKMLYRRFNEIWSWLPDRPDIHRHPFGRLCNLCSEYWVFEEERCA